MQNYNVSPVTVRKQLQGILKEERNTGLLLVFPSFLLVLVFVCYPVLSNIILSFYKVNLSQKDDFIGTKNFAVIFSNPEFWKSLYYSIVYVLSTTLLTTALGVIVAVTLNKPFPFRGIIRAVALFPYVAPIIAVVYGWQFFFDPVNGIFIDTMLNKLHLIQERMNLLNSPQTAIWFAILFSIWKNFPFTYLMVLAQLQAIDRNLYEAAAIDGASSWQSFKAITLPHILFVVGATILLRFIWNFNKFEEVYLFSSSVETLPIFTYFQAFTGNIDLGRGAAISVIQFLLIVGIIFFYVKRVLKW